VEVRNLEASPMLDDWDERDEVVAAGSICPVPDCGALVVSYRPTDRAGRDNAKIVVRVRVCAAEPSSSSLKMN
jgi:hypothetical protein